MENKLNEMCPICIENPAKNYTECGHGYCIDCLSRIKICAICRKPLLRDELCKEIKQHFNKKNDLQLGRDSWSEPIPNGYVREFARFWVAVGDY